MRKLSLKELNRIDVEAFKQRDKQALSLVLDNIRSGLNVGAAFRTGDAFAIRELLLCGITAQPPHREILKTAIGASKSVIWSYHQSTLEAIQNLKEQGVAIYGIEQTDRSIPLQEVRFIADQPYALVFGNEVTGISEDVLPLLDGAIEIPQFGTKHSLNVSVCFGILCWEFTRQIQLDQLNK